MPNSSNKAYPPTKNSSASPTATPQDPFPYSEYPPLLPTCSVIANPKKSIIPTIIARLPIPNFISFTSLRTKPYIGPELAPLSADIDRYLLASKRNESIIYRIGDVFEEVRSPEFTTAGGTIAAGTLLGGAVWAQVVSSEVRVYDSGKGPLGFCVVDIDECRDRDGADGGD